MIISVSTDLVKVDRILCFEPFMLYTLFMVRNMRPEHYSDAFILRAVEEHGSEDMVMVRESWLRPNSLVPAEKGCRLAPGFMGHEDRIREKMSWVGSEVITYVDHGRSGPNFLIPACAVVVSEDNNESVAMAAKRVAGYRHDCGILLW